jgi:hypothetical protein
MVRHTVRIALVLVVSVHCRFDLPPIDASAESINERTFRTTITPLVTECISCHGGPGITPPNLTSLDMLQDRYKMKPGNTNILVTKGGHSGVPYLPPPELDMVTNWINDLR